MMKIAKILIGEFKHETNTFSNKKTGKKELFLIKKRVK